MTVSSKVRIYDLAKELKLDTKRLIEEVRREGVDVSVPSNSVSKELAEKIRNKYFPKKETAVKRVVKVVKRASLPTPEAPLVEAEDEQEPEPIIADAPDQAPEPLEAPAIAAPPAAAKQPIPARLIKKLTPATRAEAPAPEAVAEEPVIEDESALPVVEPPVVHEPIAAIEASEPPTNGVEVRTPAPPPGPAPLPPPSRQVRVMRPTAAALNAGIRPGERAPAPAPPPPAPTREREQQRPTDRAGRLRERPSLRTVLRMIITFRSPSCCIRSRRK